MIYIKQLKSGLNLYKALSSEIRLDIIELLCEHKSLNMNEIAKKLNLTNGAVTMHIKKLEESGIIQIVSTVAKHGIQKICYLVDDKIMIDFTKQTKEDIYEVEIKVGHYKDYLVTPTCGLATKDKIIGEFDDPRHFANPCHVDSEILWLTTGYVEYWLPNYLKSYQKIDELQLSLELGSEAPSHRNEWPSDIYFYLNNTEVGYWTSPGDFGGEKEKRNPNWWPPHLNQYGVLKLLRINLEGSFIDGRKISNITINDININSGSPIKFKIAVPTAAVNPNGLTIYGESFGRHPQNIIARVLYSNVPN
ncbi:ArsR/SmtB family transcription factor [Peribacillus frigoritolerans]